jgi:hypothetical protein
MRAPASDGPHPPDLLHDETTARNKKANDAMMRERTRWDGMLGDSSINRRLKTLLARAHDESDSRRPSDSRLN